ncbi:hypothetical protein [Thermovibrio ammonificans]|nr:hypothetical protein [Thermovibrio ammonificans]
MKGMLSEFFASQDWSDLNGVARIALSKKTEGRGSRDFGFECLVQIKLASYFLENFESSGEFKVYVGERLGRLKIKPDLTLVKPDWSEGTLLELKTIADNNFSWLKGDVEKLRRVNLPWDKFLLSVNCYLSPQAFEKSSLSAERFAEREAVGLLLFKPFYKSDCGVTFSYALFKV